MAQNASIADQFFSGLGKTTDTQDNGRAIPAASSVVNSFYSNVKPVASNQPLTVTPQKFEQNVFQKTAQTVTSQIKGINITELGKSLVAGAKSLPGMVKQAGGIIAGAWVGQQQSVNSFFKKTPEPVKNILRSVSPQFQAFEKVQDVVEKIATKSVAPKALELREQGTKETQFARNEYQKNKQPSQGLQGLLEMVTYNLPQVAASTGLSLATAFVTKNPIAAATVGLSTSYGLGASEVYNQARSDGQSDKQALPLSMIGGAIIGAIDFLPLSKLIEKTGAVETVKKSLIKNIATNIVSIGTQAGFEGITEGLQEIIGNAVARTYNENQDLFEGVKESAIVGAILGGVTDVSLSTAIAVTGKGDVKATIQSIEKKVDEALSTPAEKRTPEQKMIAATILTQSLTPDDAMSFVLENDLGKTETGKEIVKLVVQGKQQGKNLRITPAIEGDSLDVTLVDPNAQEETVVIGENDVTQNRGGQNVLNKEFSYEPAKDLSPEESIIEKRFGEKIIGNVEKIITDYQKKFGNVLNTDNVREFSEDYESNRSLYSRAVHEPSSALTRYMYDRLLNTPDPEGKNLVMFTAGGTGAGKTTAIDNIPAMKRLKESSKIVYDTNMNTLETSIKRIDQALETGHDVIITFVESDIRKAYEQMVSRAVSKGRTVPLKYHIDTHFGANETIFKLAKHYKDNSNVDIKIVDNTGNKEDSKMSTLEELMKKGYNSLNREEIYAELQSKTEQKFKNKEISRDIFQGIRGNEGKTEPKASSTGSGNKPRNGNESDKPQVKKTSQTKEGIAPLPVGQGKPKQSKAYTRVVDRLQEETRMDTIYNRLNLEEDAKRAVEFIESNPQEALRVALGIDPPPPGQTETAISIALADRAAVEENYQLQSQLESARSLRQTRRGQEIVSERGRFNDESPYRYVQTLLDRRLREIGKGVIPTSTEEVQSILNKGESGSKKRAVEKVDRVAKELKTRLTKEQTKINLAQDIINSLIC